MINCEAIVNEIKEELKEEVSKFETKPCLSIVQVGDDPASNKYISGKLKDCKEIGVETKLIKLPEDASFIEVGNVILELNNNEFIHGIILQLPLPEHLSKHEKELSSMISIHKDVDGFREESKYIPCTPKGVLTLLKRIEVDDLEDMNITLIGYGKLVNRPLFKLLSDMGANVTVCRSHVSKQNLRYFCLNSDIIITAVGKRNLLTRDMVRTDHVIIDCGITVENGKQYGDCSEDVYDITKLCTPRVKGIGLFTRISLIENTIAAFKENIPQKEDPKWVNINYH